MFFSVNFLSVFFLEPLNFLFRRICARADSKGLQDGSKGLQDGFMMAPKGFRMASGWLLNLKDYYSVVSVLKSFMAMSLPLPLMAH